MKGSEVMKRNDVTACDADSSAETQRNFDRRISRSQQLKKGDGLKGLSIYG